MKKLLIIILLIAGCKKQDFMAAIGNKKFKVGDCIILSTEKPEVHESNIPDYKIIELGEKAYYSCFVYRGSRLTTDCDYSIKYGYYYEYFYQKVDCGNLK